MRLYRAGPAAELKAYAYLRLSVDKEDGKVQSIEAQRNAIRAYAEANSIEIVEEFADCGISGRSGRRPEFQRLIDQATAVERPVQLVLTFALSRPRHAAVQFQRHADRGRGTADLHHRKPW